VATGTYTHGWREPGAPPAASLPAVPSAVPGMAAAGAALTLARAKYPAVRAVAPTSAAAVQFD